MSGARFDFSDAVVLVTGAARGVGRAIVQQFAGAGAAVVAVDREEEGLLETARLAERAAGPAMPGDVTKEATGVTTFVTDIRNRDEVTALMASVEERFGRLDICVNNAAVAPHEGLLEYRESLWETVYDVNCKGTFLMTQAAATLMIRCGVAGRIINFSSGAALKGGHGGAAYASSRAATESFSRVAAMELAPHGILVNTVRPGLIDTQPKPLPPRMKAALEARIPTLPLRRPGRAEEVAGAVLFLASPLSSYMTGSVLTVDGGSSVGSYSDRKIVDDDSRYFWFSAPDAT